MKRSLISKLKIMKNILYTLCFIALSAGTMCGQQSIEIPHNYNNQFLRNPAATGIWDELEVSAFYTKAFSNVDNAPTTFFGAMQYPVAGQNGAFGLSLISEKASLLSSTSLAATYAYKLRGLLNKDDFLSMGLGMNLNYFGFDGTRAIVVDGNEPNLGGQENGFGINFQAGVLYSTSNNINKRGGDDFIYQIGIGMARLDRSVNIRSLYTLQEQTQLNGFASVIYSADASLKIQSYIETLYETSGQLNMTLGGRATLAESIIIGASFDSHLALGVEIGYRMKAFGDVYSSVVANFNVPFGQVNDFVNPGIGLSYHHAFDLNGGW